MTMKTNHPNKTKKQSVSPGRSNVSSPEPKSSTLKAKKSASIPGPIAAFNLKHGHVRRASELVEKKT